MDIQGVRALIADDMAAVDALLHARLHSEVALIGQLSHYIINGGGKRLRPALAILSARASGYEGTRHTELAVIVEMIHTATLLHDDVVDGSQLRRGQETANQVWGNEASVLVGDFLYSRAFQMMVMLGDMQVMEILADATNTIAEGEVLQLINRHDPEITEHRYLEVIRHKTAKLFEAAGRLGAVVAARPAAEAEALAAYGRHLGTAFQLIDDVLDYSASAEQFGKNIGDDLAEGKPTLPLLYALWNGTRSQRNVIQEAIRDGGLDRISAVQDAIESTGAISYTARLAGEEGRSALARLESLPPSSYREALEGLAAFAVERVA